MELRSLLVRESQRAAEFFRRARQVLVRLSRSATPTRIRARSVAPCVLSAGTSAGRDLCRGPGLRGCGLPHALRPDCLRSLYFRTPYLWSPLFRSLCAPAGDAAGARGQQQRGDGAVTGGRPRLHSAQVPQLRPGLEHPRRAPGTGWRLSHEVTDFRSSSSVVPRSLPARPRSMSTATRISVFSVIRSPSPPRWRLRVRRILASSSSWSARSRSSLRSRRCHFGIRDSVTPAVPASRGTRATCRGAGLRGSGFSAAAAGAASAGASLGGRTAGAWSTSPSKSATLCRGISSRPSRPRSGRGRAAARYARA